MHAMFKQTSDKFANITIYCALFLAFFIAGAICGFCLATSCDKQILQKYCVELCLSWSGLFWLLIPAVRFLSLLALCRRFRIGVYFMPALFFLRGISAVFCLTAFCLTLPEVITLGRGILYFVYMTATLSLLIGFGWLEVCSLNRRKFGRTSYGKHHHEI